VAGRPNRHSDGSAQPDTRRGNGQLIDAALSARQNAEFEPAPRVAFDVIDNLWGCHASNNDLGGRGSAAAGRLSAIGGRWTSGPKSERYNDLQLHADAKGSAARLPRHDWRIRLWPWIFLERQPLRALLTPP
jgi:hypothetical protein